MVEHFASVLCHNNKVLNTNSNAFVHQVDTRLDGEEYNCRVLVKNRFALAKIFQDMEILPATLEDLMLFYTKGEKLK